MPRLGTEKVHHKLTPLIKLHNIKIGRDGLYDLLRDHHLLIRQRKRKVVTTYSRHWMHKYTNRIKTMIVTRPEQLWVSDITYIRTNNQWAYLSLITDAYSRRIMGVCLRPDMAAQGCIDALKMALGNRCYPHQPLIHHSDRGSQYCSAAYVKLLNDHSIDISMTENGDPYENALAERVNGIIKGEFNLHESRVGFEATYQLVNEAILTYNQQRPHASCDFLTPDQAHQMQGPLKKRWKQYPKRKMISEIQSATSKKGAVTAPLTEQGTAPFLRQSGKTLSLKPKSPVQ